MTKAAVTNARRIRSFRLEQPEKDRHGIGLRIHHRKAVWDTRLTCVDVIPWRIAEVIRSDKEDSGSAIKETDQKWLGGNLRLRKHRFRDRRVCETAECLARKRYDPVLSPHGRPRNLLISLSNDLMCVVEIDEVGFEHARHGAVRLEPAGRIDPDGEIFAT